MKQKKDTPTISGSLPKGRLPMLPHQDYAHAEFRIKRSALRAKLSLVDTDSRSGYNRLLEAMKLTFKSNQNGH